MIVEAILKLYEDSSLSDPEIKVIVEQIFPDFSRVLEIWITTSIQRTTLTAVGKAIAYSCLTGQSSFRAPIEIWVN